MRMGFFMKTISVGSNLCTYRGLSKIYHGFGARDSRLLPWKHKENLRTPVKTCKFWDSNENLKRGGLHAGRTTKFAPVKSLRFSELILGILLFEFRCTVFFPLGCGVDSWIPPFLFFETAKGKAPKKAWGGRLSSGEINVTFLCLHEPQLGAMFCVALNQIDAS